MMTTEPVILGPEATIAEALATVRREELAPALASMVYVCRPPLEAPTGRYLGLVHIQRLLREPPHAADRVDHRQGDRARRGASDSLETVTRTLATYNLVSLPVVDDDGRLIGAVTVDDVLDHILPEDWREERHEIEVRRERARRAAHRHPRRARRQARPAPGAARPGPAAGCRSRRRPSGSSRSGSPD